MGTAQPERMANKELSLAQDLETARLVPVLEIEIREEE